ncbi:MAG: methylated-DNA--[protein]-cysteine S-methyltransferase [Oscillospiraceae bacterium]|nr:methylated-DNA--[protein]-cysteine S-methyltransferase [Oscillospiraceae bacterium]
MLNTVKYKSPFGAITIQEKDGAIFRICLPNEEPNTAENLPEHTTELLKNAKKQFAEYFGGKCKVFDLPLNFYGCTEFMKSVYQELLKIPYGEMASYKQIAGRVGCPKGYRAVGLANNKNPLPIIVPCHRVIGSDGSMTGYRGGIDMKIKLLELERNNFVEFKLNV